jgi:peptidyl-Lys metalloendopeptidase
MSKNIRFKWLGLAGLTVSAALLGACVGTEEDQGASPVGAVVVDDAVDPAAGDVSVQLSAHGVAVGANDDVSVTVTLTNNAKRAVKLLSWYAPSEELEEDLFLVTREGQAVEYIGPHYKRPAPTDKDFIVIPPGKSVTREVSLSNFYDLSKTGNYEVRYAVDLKQANGKEPASLESNGASLWIEGRANNSPDAKAGSGTTEFTSSVAFNKCTTTQQSTVLQALGAASTMADDSVAYLNGTAPSGTPRYSTWFGAFSSNGWGTAQSHFTAIKDAIDTKSLKFDCGCKKQYYAYVYPNQPYNVYLCSVFWSAPLSGTDSKGGTIIHELSHFDVIAQTDDWAYGQTNAKSLAKSDPVKALNNADNHEYFSENTPFLQ